MPSSRRSRSMSASGTGSVVASTMSAEPAVERPTSMSAMLTPASPSMRADERRSSRAGRRCARRACGRPAGVRRVVVDVDDARLAPPSGERAGQRVPAAAHRDQVHVVDATSTSTSRAPRRRARSPAAGAFTNVTGSSLDAAEQTLQHRQCEDAGVVVGESGPRSRPRATSARRPPARRTAAQPLGQRQERAAPSRDASAALTFTAKGTNSPASASSTCSAMVSPALSCASRVRRAEVRGHHHAGQAEQRRLGRRLLVEDVERGPADPAALDGLGQRRLVDDAAPGRR